MSTQHQVRHAEGALPSCTCGRQPRHYHDKRRPSAGGGEFLECSPCDRRTRRHASLELAIAEFCRATGAKSPSVAAPRLTHVR